MKITKALLLLLLIAPCISCRDTAKPGCSKFKNGSFSAYSELTGFTYLVQRKGKLQIETEKETGTITEWRVRWLDECNYNLTLIKDNRGMLSSGKFAKPPSFNYEIIETTDRYYIFRGQFDPSQPAVTDTIWKAD